jgi:hypothetical protein
MLSAGGSFVKTRGDFATKTCGALSHMLFGGMQLVALQLSHSFSRCKALHHIEFM